LQKTPSRKLNRGKVFFYGGFLDGMAEQPKGELQPHELLTIFYWSMVLNLSERVERFARVILGSLVN
jgi:hypothetical protein